MKILIADSGSTKTLWALVDTEKGDPTLIRPYMTGGLNPLYSSEEIIVEACRVVAEVTGEKQPDALYFYGSGCTASQIPLVERGLRRVFRSSATHIEVASDLLGTCRALYNDMNGGDLVTCILGTGSIAALYDGQQQRSVSALGYILGDEGSGAWLGRKVLADYLKDQMPQKTRSAFEEDFGVITPEQAIDRTYRQLFPNRYLASFAEFVGHHLDDHGYCQQLAFRGIENFWDRNVKRVRQLSDSKKVAFVGSVAYHLRSIVEQVAALNDYEVVGIMQNPMEGLIRYHLENK